MLSRRADAPASEGVRWVSAGQGEYSVETVERPERGTTVQLKLKADAAEFKDVGRLRALIRKYSDHVAFPVKMPSQGGAEETVNRAKALWTRPRAEIKDDEYVEFYKQLAHDTEDPLTWSHNRVEGKREYTSLLYIPSVAPFDLWNRRIAEGREALRAARVPSRIKRRSSCRCTFASSVVSSTRASCRSTCRASLLQQDEAIGAMRSALTKRVLDMLERLADEHPDKYATFWSGVRNAHQRRAGRGCREPRQTREAVCASTPRARAVTPGPQPQAISRGCQTGAKERLLLDRRVGHRRALEPAFGDVP